MFVCGYHFPASEGNDVSFEKVIEKVNEGIDAAGKTVTLTSETREGVKLETLEVPANTFLHTALVDYFTNTECKEVDGFKMVYGINETFLGQINRRNDA